MNLIPIYLIVLILFERTEEILQDDIVKELNKTSEKSLIRKRRYIVFPTGSSFQLVYCLTMPSVGMGQIFTLGATAALAWELPADTETINEIFGKHNIKSTTTTTEQPTLPALIHDDYHEHYGQYDNMHDKSTNSRIDGIQGSRSSVFSNFGSSSHNPFSQYSNFFGYSSPIQQSKYNSAIYPEYSRNYGVEFNKNPVHPVYHQIHRRTRRSLYAKIENMLTALSKDGKACLLKAICEVSQVKDGQGSFLEEIIKAIFRIKPHEHYPNEDIYDEAANTTHDCNERYSSCKHSVWHDMF